MDNIIKGRVVAVPPMATGEGQRGPWKRQTVVIEFQEGRYTSKLALDNSFKADEFAKLRPGQVVTCHYDVTSREYNGRYYHTVTCFDWEVEGAQVAAPANANNAPATAAQDKGDGLPF